jgi:hypothetical protein
MQSLMFLYGFHHVAAVICKDSHHLLPINIPSFHCTYQMCGYRISSVWMLNGVKESKLYEQAVVIADGTAMLKWQDMN